MRTPPTELARTTYTTGCCPPFDPKTWDEREVVWHDRQFVKEHVISLFHVPLNMGRTIARAKAKIAAADAEPIQSLMLADERSPWGSDLYIEATKLVPGTQLGTLSGRFLTKVYDGPYRDMGKWVEDMSARVAAKGEAVEKIYFGYTTCPKCAKTYGHNYVVLFARVTSRPS